MNEKYSMVDYLLMGQESVEKEKGTKTPSMGSQDISPGQMLNIRMARQLCKIVDDMPGGFFIYRANGDEEIIFANAALVRLFGCDSLEEFRQLTGNSFKGLVHPDDLEAVEKSIWEQIAHSQYDLDYVEYRIVRRDGEIRWLDDYGHFVHSEISGEIFYVFVGDVTDKKLRQMEEKAALIREKKRGERQIKQFNREMASINREYMRRFETIEGLSIDYESIFYADLEADSLTPYRMSHRVIPPVEPECRFADFEKIHDDFVQQWVLPEDRVLLGDTVRPEAIRTKLSVEKSFYINYRILEEGRIKYQQLRVVDVSKKGRGAQIVLGYRNVDQEMVREMNRKKVLEDTLKKAEAAIAAKNAFLDNMSHDIRTPMNAIVGFTALAKKYIEDPEKAKEYLEQIEVSNGQLLLILTDVLELTKLEAGGGGIEEEPCKLSSLVYEVLAELQQEAHKKDIVLTDDLSGMMHDEVLSDDAKIREILIRLLDNAVKYTPCGGSVTVSVTEKENILTDYALYQFIVADNGIGIGKEFLTHIFEPFEREKNTTMGSVPGSGLGLVIVKSIVEVMGGNIQAESTCSEGSRFTVSLTLRRKNAQGRTGGIPTLTAGISGKQKILLVEDNEINREIEIELLESDGFVVETAENGQIAVDMVTQSQAGTYGLVLMDIQMPVMDGYQAARAIRKLEDPQLAEIPIIALSANALEEDKKRAMESGMDAHMAKPLNVHLLEELLRKILQQ